MEYKGIQIIGWNTKEYKGISGNITEHKGI